MDVSDHEFLQPQNSAEGEIPTANGLLFNNMTDTVMYVIFANMDLLRVVSLPEKKRCNECPLIMWVSLTFFFIETYICSYGNKRIYVEPESIKI